MQAVNNSHQLIRNLNRALSATLILVIASQLVSSVLLILLNGITEQTYNTWYSTFIWFSFLGSIWIFTGTVLYVLGIILYEKTVKRMLPSRKLIYILFIYAVASAIVFILSAAYVSYRR